MAWLRSGFTVLCVVLLPVLAFILVGHHLQGTGFAALEMGLTWAGATTVISLRERHRL